MEKKNLIIPVAALFFISCNSYDNKNKTNNEVIENYEHHIKNSEEEMKLSSETENKIKKGISFYLQLKNALVQQNTSEAKQAGNRLSAELKSIDIKWMNEKQAAVFTTYGNAIVLYANSISVAEGNITEQKKYFEQMNIAAINLVKMFGSNAVLYKKMCTLYNDGKGGYWLSEFNGAENPLYDSSKLACVKTVETIK